MKMETFIGFSFFLSSLFLVEHSNNNYYSFSLMIRLNAKIDKVVHIVIHLN